MDHLRALLANLHLFVDRLAGKLLATAVEHAKPFTEGLQEVL